MRNITNVGKSSNFMGHLHHSYVKIPKGKPPIFQENSINISSIFRRLIFHQYSINIPSMLHQYSKNIPFIFYYILIKPPSLMVKSQS
jgi:hypothetical protein